MKKNLLLVFLMSAFFNCIYAQTTLISEGFEGATFPAGWAVFDVDADGNEWGLFTGAANAHSGNQFAAVQYNSAGNDDWLVTNGIALPAGQTISFSLWAKSLNPSYLEDFQIAITDDGGTNWYLVGSETGIASSYIQYNYDVSAYAGSTVYLAIICNSVDEDHLCIDDVLLTATGGGGGPVIAGTPVGTIGDYFVQGVSPVNNSISISGAPSGTNTIDFYATDSTYSIAYDSLKNVSVGGTWTLDMGSLPPGSVIWANYYDNSSTYLGYSNDYFPIIIPTPQWLQTLGYVDNVSVAGNSVQMLGHFYFGNQSNSMPNDIPGLGNKAFNLNYPEITYDIDFDCSNGFATAAAPNANFSLDVLNQQTFSYNYPIPNLSSLTFDNNFNPEILAEGSYNTTPFEIKWPLAKLYPLLPSPFPVVKIDGGLSIDGELRGKMMYGYNTTYNAWGIDTARVTAKINATATLRVTADALIANASGTLIGRGSIGGGLEYTDFPSATLTPLFGMDLEIAGTIDYKLGRGIFTVAEGHLEKTFYQKTWGDQLRVSPFEKQVWDNIDAKGNYTRMMQSNPYLQTPDFFAQPNMSANDSALYTVWLDYSGNNTDILFSKLNYQSGYFSTPATVTSAAAISNPKVAILPSGNALISWTQNRYDGSNYDTTTMDLTNLLNAQDIWVTLYDKGSNSFVTPIMLSDDNSSLESGRAEGNANIIMGKGQYGLITWVVNNDATNENADVWYCTVTESGSSVFLGTPTQLINLSGTNKSINIAYSDSTNAIACWINDPDGLDSTLNNEVVYQEWDQISQSWGSINTLISNNGSISFDDLSVDFNGIYGAVAWTTTEYDVDGNFAKGIYTDAWDWSSQNWATYSYALDTNYYFAQPKVSVNKNGYVALTYQAISLFSDTLNPDVGQLNLYLNDSQNDPTTWTPNNGNPLLGDPAVYDWSLNTTYGDLNNFYIITQEADTITGNAPVSPPNGVRFGNNYLNLVFRALDVSPTVITDIEEPSTGSTFNNKNSFDFNLYPNPVVSYTTIEYSLNSKSVVAIEVYDLLGNKIAKVFEGKQNQGTYKAVFEPNGLSSGIYLCKVTINDQSVMKRMVLVK